MRILLAASGSRGDTDPQLALGLELQRRGHRVMVTASPTFQEDAGRLGLDFQPMGVDLRQYLEQMQQAGKDPMKPSRDLLRLLRSELRTQLETLLRLSADADLMVGCGTLTGGLSAAEAAGVPYRYLVHTPWVFPTSYHAPPLFPDLSFPKAINRAMWKVYKAAHDRLLLPVLNEWRTAHGLSPVEDALTKMYPQDDVVVICEPELSPYPPDLSTLPPQSGIPQLPDSRGLPEDVLAFIERGTRPIYIGFGSMPVKNPQQRAHTLLEAVRLAGCRAIISAGWAGVGVDDLPSQLKGQVMLVGALSHVHLFPKVAAVVHHGGSGTAANAARAGIPQIIVPHDSDHFWWGRHLHEIGIAPKPILQHNLTPKRLSAAIREVLHEPDCLQRALALSAQMRRRDTMDDVARAVLRGFEAAPAVTG